MEEMKLAAIVSLFDGEELLEGALRQLRPEVAVVICLWQQISYTGEAYVASPGPHALQARGLIDIIAHYAPAPRLGGTANEVRKRQQGLELARQQGCTHFLYLDADEYYEPLAFRAAKAEALRQGWDATACRLYTYYRRPIYRLQPMEDYYVPFICKLLPATRPGYSRYPVRVDPTRGVNTCRRFHAFAPARLLMHHYSWLRRDMGLKLRNSSACPNYRRRIPQLLECFKSWEYPAAPCFFEGYGVELAEDIFGLGGAHWLG